MAISMAGLDLSFLKSPKSQAFSKKIHADNRKRRAKRVAERRDTFAKRSELPSPVVMSDIKPFISPVDRKLISSRDGLRRHNRTHRVDQCGDVKLEDYLAHVDKQNDVGPINPNEVSFEWKQNDR